MDNKSFDIDRVIVDFLTNDILEEDLAVLDRWREQSASNEEEFVKMKSLWEKSQNLKLFEEVNEEEDWKKIQSRIQSSKGKVVTMQSVSKRNVFAFRKIAVALVPLIVLSVSLFVYWNVPGFGNLAKIESGGQLKNINLPDQSEVILNKYSKLIYRNNIANSSERNVEVEGEAFFHVKHNDTPFKVHVKDAIVEVMGTQFDVDERGHDLYVSVVSGKVKVTFGKQEVELTKGERAVLKDNDLKEEKGYDLNDLYWKSKELKFEQATLEEICKVLKDSFDEIDKVVFKCKKDEIKVSTTFNNQSLQDILEELTIHFNKKMSLNNKTLIISD